MPIGTSDGQHFEDEFHQEVAKASNQAVSPYNPNYDITSPYMKGEESQNIEDRRFENPIRREQKGQIDPKETNPFAVAPNRMNYMAAPNKEPDQLAKDAGIESIPTTMSDNLRRVLYDPKVQEALSKPETKVIRDYEVPYVAGASSVGSFTYVDKSVPKSIVMPGISGKTGQPTNIRFDPAVPLHIHEQVEKEVMERLIAQGYDQDKAYEIAHHEYAQPVEDMWYRRNGINVDQMNNFWSKINTKTEKDKGDFPLLLYKKPYPHDQVKGSKHTPTNVFAEKPATTPAE